MSKALESLLPCPCGLQAELHEWEEIDATRWAARAKCNCGWEGPIGYADNHRGCYDAVNDLHKKRAIAAWNKRAPKAEPETPPKYSAEYAHSVDALCTILQNAYVGYTGENLPDGEADAMASALLTAESNSTAGGAREALLQTIDTKALAGLCAMTHPGTRAFLKDIREIIASANERKGS